MGKTSIEYPDLEPFFRPKSIAIAWASNDPLKLGGVPLRQAIERGYKGRIFPVNPGREVVQGLKSYPSILDIPEEVDVALLVMRASDVADALRQCVKKGIKAAVVSAVGFAEVGGEGKQRQDEILEICKGNGLRICGPNTNGLANVREGVTLGYSYAQGIAIPGRLGYVAQSGAMLSAVVPRFGKAGIGISYFVSSGNQADLDTFDYVKFMLDDPGTDAIALYIEGLKDAGKFSNTADLALEKGKPLIVLKIGRSEQAARAAMAHTGSLVGSDLVFDAVCRQKGITRVYDFDSLIATTSVLLKCKLPRGNRIGVLSNSGAIPGIIADHAMGLGLNFPEMSAGTREKAARILPGWPASGKMDNFWDFAAALPGMMPEMGQSTFELFARDENFDIIIGVSTPIAEAPARKAILSAFAKIPGTTGKPLIMLVPKGSLTEEEAEPLAASNPPITTDVADCTGAVAALIKYSQALKSRRGEKAPAEPLAPVNVKKIKERLRSEGKTLSEHESKKLLMRYGIQVTEEEIARSPREAAVIAGRIGYPVALKIDSPDIIHKTDAGAVRLNIRNETELAAAYSEVMANAKKHQPKAEIGGVLVQEMVDGGREVIVGISHDPQFGPTIIFGLGGVFVEVLKDFSLRIPPVNRSDAEAMVKGIRGYKMLEAFRGRPEADIEGIIDVLLRVSQMATDLEDIISEVDINPLTVMASGKGVKAVDALVVLK